MKKKVYVFCFMVLGLMTGFLLHAVIEVLYIPLLMRNFQTYGLGLDWWQWESIHNWGVPVLTILGGILGFRQGKKWWNVLYIQKKYSRYFSKPLKSEFS